MFRGNLIRVCVLTGRILEYSTPLSRVIRRILLSSAQHGSGGTQPRTAQRGKVPPIPTVVAVILADDGAVSVDPDKLADVVSWYVSDCYSVHDKDFADPLARNRYVLSRRQQ